MTEYESVSEPMSCHKRASREMESKIRLSLLAMPSFVLLS